MDQDLGWREGGEDQVPGPGWRAAPCQACPGRCCWSSPAPLLPTTIINCCCGEGRKMSRRSIFHFPVVHNQFQAHSLKINLHQARYLLINITSYNMYSPAQAQPLLMYNEMEPGLGTAGGNSPAGSSNPAIQHAGLALLGQESSAPGWGELLDLPRTGCVGGSWHRQLKESW